MSTQELDVKKSWRAIRRHRRWVALVAAVGLLGGIVYALVEPPLHTATSLVVLPPPPATDAEKAAGTQAIETQVFIADSEPVLKSAGQNLAPPLATEVVRDRVKVAAVTQDVIKIDARGTSAAQAMRLANAVAEVYLVFVTTDQKLPGDLGKKTGARVLEEATTARGGNMAVHLGIFGLLGALLGAVAGSIGVLARVRGDRRLRLRDEISDAVGLPVLASVSSYRAEDISDWAYLLEHYSPTAVDAWSLRKTLHHLGLDVKGGAPVSLSVISFAEDDKSVALGAQLAAFANSIGISTSIVVDTHHEPAGKVALGIHLVVVDRDAPHLTGAARTTSTIVALSAGSVTAEELARLAVAAAADDRNIDGLVVTDPDPSDRTIGRVSQSSRRSGSRLPTLLTGTARRTNR
ncbi:Wzz/FepE/Etk N-terminal domain-containing protein [Kribbella sp. VKM Ac-2568]|uniref:Wzz/FepE/Etk N-terminal domain-containing protein n=1 Tax=Kribbella sp. VKM Ac-2568 TaxID=2512219 RepID=UPI001048D55B|nr:Wzz/FepE/Etk N-terminal domain-containing protein [Kribbella sp. VKM Ac-2568]TCM44204.1 capsular polysaccharide biosynthesis protein [Kribbella sp. VKM Ac-2568]